MRHTTSVKRLRKSVFCSKQPANLQKCDRSPPQASTSLHQAGAT
ncbi:hypothetical protein BH720_007450 [Desertifilum tharense IPPAS B-1220]